MNDMMGKTVLFLTVDGFDGNSFYQLWHCFGESNASTRIASFDAGEEIRSRDGLIKTNSDISFNNAVNNDYDVVVIADGVTARALLGNDDIKDLMLKVFDQNGALVSVDDGALTFINNGVVKGLTIAGPNSIRPEADDADVDLLNEPLLINNNIFTAQKTADMQALCDSVSEYITTLRAGEAA